MRRLGTILIVLAALGAFALAWVSVFVDWPQAFPDPQLGVLMTWMTLLGVGVLGFAALEQKP